jgi:hypothetical protein
MNFTFSYGVITNSIENNAFTMTAGIEIFQSIGNTSFLQQ